MTAAVALPRPEAEPTRGLSPEQARAALAAAGPNELAHDEPTSRLKLLARQFSGLMTWLLIGACVVSVAVGEAGDAIAIGVILVVNALVGFFQEARAEKAVRALRAMTAPHARVLRGGSVVDVASREVVPGDVLVLDAGDIVAADAHLVEANRLKINEAALTGESMPVEKSAGEDDPKARLAERHTVVFAGTPVVLGGGRAVVTATGMKTEIGRIATMLQTAEADDTPLQKRLEKVGKTLVWLCAGIVVVVAGLELLRGHTPVEVLLSAVSLAVAAVPEGLTAIVTIALALGVQRMAQRHVLVRRLSAVETLGCATVICTDKTGTLTTGEMAVRDVRGGDPERILYAAAACSDADIDGNTGDPTELALLRAAFERGIERATIERERPRILVQPFDSERKRMSIFRGGAQPGGELLYVKGAVDLLLPLCTSGTAGVVQANTEMAVRGLRVLAVAVGKTKDERDLELLGLVGMADPPRTEAIEAVRNARAAGIKTVMITGDHPATALAIAKEMGIVRQGDDPAELVHARATPEEKVEIVRSWKKRGEIVAMTGDGVNDAPALKEAHIGIAMGKGGTEVAREASAMVLADDSFASIVAAVREGRGIFDNIRKALVYLLSGNFGELLVMLTASIIGLPLPLTALQLLWVNLVTDGLPALALVVDPPSDDTLARAPRKPSEPMLGRREWTEIVVVGTLTAAVVVTVFAWGLRNRELLEARNLAFSVLVFSEVLRSAASRHPTKVFWEVGAFSNVTLLGVIVVSTIVQVGIHHMPWTERAFDIGPISLADCMMSLLLGLIPVTLLELRKLAIRAMHRSRT